MARITDPRQRGTLLLVYGNVPLLTVLLDLRICAKVLITELDQFPFGRAHVSLFCSQEFLCLLDKLLKVLIDLAELVDGLEVQLTKSSGIQELALIRIRTQFNHSVSFP